MLLEGQLPGQGGRQALRRVWEKSSSKARTSKCTGQGTGEMGQVGRTEQVWSLLVWQPELQGSWKRGRGLTEWPELSLWYCVMRCRMFTAHSWPCQLSPVMRFSGSRKSQKTQELVLQMFGQFLRDMTRIGFFFIERSVQIFYCFVFQSGRFFFFFFQKFFWSGLSSFLVFSFSLFSFTVSFSISEELVVINSNLFS